MGSGVVVLGPHSIPQQPWFLFMHSFIEIVFIEHFTRPQGSEIPKSVWCELYFDGGALVTWSLERSLT